MGYGSYMFGKKEFGVKCETEISDMRFPRDDSVLSRTLHCHRQNRITHVICMILYHLNTRPTTLCKRDLVPLPTLTLIIVPCYIYIAFLINFI